MGEALMLLEQSELAGYLDRHTELGEVQSGALPVKAKARAGRRDYAG